MANVCESTCSTVNHVFIKGFTILTIFLQTYYMVIAGIPAGSYRNVP